MLGIGLALRGIALFLMWYISNPKLMKLSKPEDEPVVQNALATDQIHVAVKNWSIIFSSMKISMIN